MDSTQIVLYATNQPMPDVETPGPNQIYKDPHIVIENRVLGELHPDEIRVEMLYAGLCGTDVHVVRKDKDTGYIKSSAPMSVPEQGRVIGHEGVGRVIDKGSNVKNVGIDAIVTFESIIVCHYCNVCRKGQFNQCQNAMLLGLEKDGLFGNVVDVPSMLAHEITDIVHSDADLQALACVEPAGVAYVACQNTAIKGGDNVVIFGAGPIGIFAAILSKAVFGASAVHIVEPVKFRRAMARHWCDYVYSPDQFYKAVPGHIDVIIEASGEMDNINNSFRKINANGRIALLARSGKPLAIGAIDHMITNAVSLIGSRGHLCGAFTDIITLYKQGRLPLGEVVTQIVPDIEHLKLLLETPEKVISDDCKVLVRFNPSNLK